MNIAATHQISPHRYIGIVLLLAATAPTSLSATVLGDEVCQIYSAGSSDTPKPLQSFLVEKRMDAGWLCSKSNGEVTSYAKISPSFSRLFGVCQFSMEPLTMTDGYKTISETRIYMAPPRKSCLPRADGAYVRTIGVSEGVFLSIVKLVAQMTKSQQEFESAIVTTKPVDKNKYEKLRNDLMNSAGTIHISSISLNPPEMGISVLGYNVILSKEGSERHWSLNTDMTPDGFRVLQFDEIRS